ncbi:CBO0543 family protein [Lentibacillus amyloliquefaciens]|uniref:Uncharacterized protein n=1 Tax=Lentibacillus amyloliquefaciens TaxID=1472767 RepID=A0A0U4E9S1_9BACI|nr:CBO0543 family protein [Lentibacillus amyloliquefaciens]ALX47257.1 hypothetical protein AOX59_00765 [Lentibacillus amyloliquefaciens]
MHIFVAILFMLASWRWADWTRFHQFHATMVYIAAMNLLYFFFTSDYHLWTFHSNISIPGHVLDLLHTFIVLPCTAMIFLSNFPDAFFRNIIYTAKWALIFLLCEWGGYSLDLIEYHNGWSLGWSALFLLVMFPMLRMHYNRPFIAYGLSIGIIAVLLTLFNVPWVH